MRHACVILIVTLVAGCGRSEEKVRERFLSGMNSRSSQWRDVTIRATNDGMYAGQATYKSDDGPIYFTFAYITKNCYSVSVFAIPSRDKMRIMSLTFDSDTMLEPYFDDGQPPIAKLLISLGTDIKDTLKNAVH